MICIFIFVLLAPIAYGEGCDYDLEILMDDEFDSSNFTWRIRAINMEGDKTNISSKAFIEKDGKIVKAYSPWEAEQISKQKTSNGYSPNLQPGKYKLAAQIFVGCPDSDLTNNEKIEYFEIKGPYGENIDSIMEMENIEVNGHEDGPIDVAENNQALTKIQENSQKKRSNNIRLSTSEIKKPEIAENNYLYMSSSEKSRKLVLPLLLILSVVLNVVLIWKR